MPAAAVMHAGPVLAAEVVAVFVAKPPAPLAGKPAVNGVAVSVAAFKSNRVCYINSVLLIGN